MSRQDALGAKRDELKRAAETEQAALERLEERGRALAAEGKLPVADIEVLSPATVPLAPTGRGRLFYLAVVILAGGMSGLTVAFALELLDKSVRGFHQLREVPGLVPCVMVPRVPSQIAETLSGLTSRGHEGMFGEAFRGLVLSLKQVGGRKLPGSLLVTSPLPGEGKSLVALALALECVASGQRVLLVDGDPTHGGIHRMFGTPDAPGLADYLRGAAELGEIIRHDPETGLDYVVRGSHQTGRPPTDDGIAQLVKAAKADGRFVIFDSVPVFAGTHAVKLAAQVDQTLLILKWGHTSRDSAASAVEHLRGDRNSNVLAAIDMLNPRRYALYGFKDADIFSKSLRRYTDSWI